MFRIDQYFPIWVYLPWFNLGCLGFKLGWGMMGWLYIDLTCWPNFGGIYCRINNRRYYSYIWQLNKWRMK